VQVFGHCLHLFGLLVLKYPLLHVWVHELIIKKKLNLQIVHISGFLQASQPSSQGTHSLINFADNFATIPTGQESKHLPFSKTFFFWAGIALFVCWS
jgi:hypothetical protein